MFKIRWDPLFHEWPILLHGGRVCVCVGKCIMLLSFSPILPDPQKNPRKPPHATRPPVCFPCLDLVEVNGTFGGSGGSSASWVLVQSSRLEILLYSILLTLKLFTTHALLTVSGLSECLERCKLLQFINKTWPGHFSCNCTKLC